MPSFDTLVNLPPTVHYGADEGGLICGFLFRPAAAGEAIDSAFAQTWLAQPEASRHGFLWLHCNLAHNTTEPWLVKHARLSDTFFEALKEPVHSTRLERAGQSLVAVVNDVRYDFSFEPSDISTLWINVDRTLIVTARLQPLRSLDRLRIEVKAGERIESSADLLVHVLHQQAEVLVRIVRDVTSKIDDAEDDLLAGGLEHKRVKLGRSRRLLVRLQRLLAPEPAALFRLLQRPPPWIREVDVEELRGSSEEFSVALRDMTSLQERIKLLQEEIAAQVNEENNKSLFVLTVVTVLALPINIVAGLLGMNVGGVPLAQHANGFWIVVSVVAGITTVAGWIALRRRRVR